MNKKQIVIIGGGLQGLATANTLIERGEEVLVLEREDDVATSTSFANAGMMTPSQSSPWNSSTDIAQIISGIGKIDSPMLVKLNQIPSLFFWGLKFLRNSTPNRFNKISRDLFALATYSKDLTVQFRDQTKASYDESQKGTLKIYRNVEALEHSINLHQKIFSSLDGVEVINNDRLVDVEPQLFDIQSSYRVDYYFQTMKLVMLSNFVKFLRKE